MEPRRIRADEAGQFLKLLCDVFSLDHKRAELIFYNEPMFDLERKWALFDGPRMVSILTTVPLQFGWGRAIGIAGVATIQAMQGKGCASILLDHVVRDAVKAGEGTAFLFARQTGVYARCGFSVLDEVVRAPIINACDDVPAQLMNFETIREIYAKWESQNPARLQRDARRWKYWEWTLRMCIPMQGGYACLEGDLLRECISEPMERMPVGKNTQWLGLRSMASACQIPLGSEHFDLFLMGINAPEIPQMFMTDQF
jgi:GNAT superfamily N-acetyltransferase